MAKVKATAFFCNNCGYESAKWMGQCPACHEWNTFVEEPKASAASKGGASKPTAGVVQWGSLGLGAVKGPAAGAGAADSGAGASAGADGRGAAGKTYGRGRALPLKKIEATDANRMSTGISEMDRVLGGGIVPGSLVLVGGDPGIGKSTLLLQVCRNLVNPAAGVRVLYVSGEESQQQIKLRANRMGEFGDDLLLLCETNLTDIQEAIADLRPEVVIVDSIQTMYNEYVTSAPGSVSQVRETTSLLMQLAKGLGITIVYRRPRDQGGRSGRPQSLRAHGRYGALFRGRPARQLPDSPCGEDRFGSTDEIGVFRDEAGRPERGEEPLRVHAGRKA